MMKSKVFILGFTILLIFGQIVFGQEKGVGNKTVSKLPAKEKRWALIIGVSQYEDGNITSLPGANNDAKALRDALRDYAGFDEKQIITLTTDESKDRQPTQNNILRYFGNLKGTVPKDGLLLVAFSGHGIERNNRAFLLASDTPYNDNVKVLERTALSVTEDINELIRDTEVKQVIILLDACRNDPSNGRSNSDNLLTQAYKNGFRFDVRNKEIEAFATIYATSIGERAYEYTRENKGYFTWAFIEALKGGAANSDGEVTLGGLIRYVEKYVPQQVKIDLGSSKLQRPFSIVEGYRADELVLGIASPKERIPNQISTTIKNSEMDFWDSIENSRNAQDFENYLLRIRSGEFAGMFKATAELKLSRLKKNAEPQPLTEQDENIKNDFAVITGGTFMMGTGGLQRTVSNFYISKYKVTQAQWQSVTGFNPSYLKGCNQCPVENVSWNQVQDFLKILNAKRDGWGYRLPTEIEWEYAARAGSALNSVQDLDATAWYKVNSGGKTHPVGEKKANKWGLFDVYGNVMEWVTDDFDQPGDNTLHIVRGCSFADESGKCTPARRERLPLDSQRSTIGFRLVKYSLPFPTGKRKE